MNHLLEGFSDRFEMAERNSSELKHKPIVIVQSEKQTKTDSGMTFQILKEKEVKVR